MRTLTIVVTFLCNSILWAQAGLPDTPVGKQLAAWFEVFTRGERSALRQYLQTNFPERAEEIDQEIEFRQQTGGFELTKVEESSATRLTAVVRERDGGRYARLVMEVEASAPHRIANLSLRLIPRPGDAPAVARSTESEALAALKAELQSQVEKDRFSGTVVVARNGRTVFKAAHGYADREKKIANELNTRFRIGSMNKMFTAVAVLQLVQSGKLALTDPVGKHLTDYPNRDVASKVTIHHLLTHSGGTGDIFGPQFLARRRELRELKDYVALYGTRAPEFEPGARFAYSNYGFLLLGVLIEKVSGRSYYDFVQKHVYEAAGMNSSGSLSEDDVVPNRSIGYMRRGGSLQPNTDTLPFRGTSAGGGYSTAEDLLRFANALLAHKLLDTHHTSLLTTGKIQGGRGKYAYGFMDFESDGVRFIGHGGGAPGMNGELRIYPNSGYVVVSLANLDPPAASRIADFISDRLPAK
jgi:CubicO group peptidase (beta-lactamase class C family)